MGRLFCQLPMKSEVYNVLALPFPDDALERLAREVIDEASVYFETAENHGGPRNWPSYEAFLGFKIADAVMVYQLNPQQLQTLVSEVYRKVIPSQSDNITDLIVGFEKSLQNLKEASRRLDKVVGPKIATASMDDLDELVENLPVHYRGTRRVYQRMLEIESNSPMDRKKEE